MSVNSLVKSFHTHTLSLSFSHTHTLTLAVVLSAAASMFPPQPAPSGRGWDVVSACVQTPGGSLQLITETTQSRECAAHGYCEFLPKASVTPPNTRTQGLTTFWTDLLHNLVCKMCK